MRFYKIKALLKLGLEDLTKNMSVFIYVLLPIIFALLYSNMDGMPESFVYSFCVLMNIAMLPVALMGTIIAEEKEKHTLRTLMLNDVKASEILFAKAIICVLFIIIDNVLMYFIVGMSMSSFVPYMLVGLFVAVAVLFFGAFVGLIAKNQMSAGLLSMPFMVILLAPVFISLMGNEMAMNIAEFLPTAAMMTIFDSIAASDITLANIGMPIGVIAGWMVISIVMFNIAYRKVGVDN